jgi:tetratricopeptide (TPR) repeat protein
VLILGSFLALESHFEKARELVGRIEDLFDGAAAFRVIAELYDYLGEVDRSIAWTMRARALEPDNHAHVEKLAEYYADLGDEEMALRLDSMGIGILFKLQRYDDMIEIAEFAMIDEPRNLRIRALLALAYNATGQYESAIHVLKDTGLPDSVFSGWRSTEESDGYLALENALYAVGEIELARELARFTVEELGYTDGYDWFLTVTKACDLAVLGEDDAARASLRRAKKGLHLPWDPVLKDAPCFDRFQDDPVYQATVRHFDEHRARLRERLPATLAEFGVTL